MLHESFVYISMKSFNSVGWLSAVAYIAAGGCSLFLVKLLETLNYFPSKEGQVKEKSCT